MAMPSYPDTSRNIWGFCWKNVEYGLDWEAIGWCEMGMGIGMGNTKKPNRFSYLMGGGIKWAWDVKIEDGWMEGAPRPHLRIKLSHVNLSYYRCTCIRWYGNEDGWFTMYYFPIPSHHEFIIPFSYQPISYHNRHPCMPCRDTRVPLPPSLPPARKKRGKSGNIANGNEYGARGRLIGPPDAFQSGSCAVTALYANPPIELRVCHLLTFLTY